MARMTNKGKECLVENCNRPAHCRGYCTGHYSRLKLHGDVQEDKPIRKEPGNFDLTGKKFSKLLVIKKSGNKNKHGAILWECKCDCGKTCEVTTANLNYGATKSCGCLVRETNGYVNLVGKRFGRLEVLKEDGHNRHKQLYWMCQCDCGNKVRTLVGGLKSGHTQSCGCLHRERASEQGKKAAHVFKKGVRVGRLTIIGKTKERKGSSVMWRCKCDCGNETLVRSVYLKDGTTKSCGCLCHDEETLIKRGKAISKALRKKYPKGIAGQTYLWNSYKSSAKKRNLIWNLSKETFEKLTSGNCFYCGTEPNQISRLNSDHGVYTYNGIDRVNNTKGYAPDNCVTCCKVCNRAKQAMPLIDFTEWIVRVHAHISPMLAPGFEQRVLAKPKEKVESK